MRFIARLIFYELFSCCIGISFGRYFRDIQLVLREEIERLQVGLDTLLDRLVHLPELVSRMALMLPDPDPVPLEGDGHVFFPVIALRLPGNGNLALLESESFRIFQQVLEMILDGDMLAVR